MSTVSEDGQVFIIKGHAHVDDVAIVRTKTWRTLRQKIVRTCVSPCVSISVSKTYHRGARCIVKNKEFWAIR